MDSDTNIKAGGEVILYQTEDGSTRINVKLQDETVWLTQEQMADLFQRDKSVISRHIHNIYEEGELRPEPTVAKFATVVNRGFRGKVTEDKEFALDDQRRNPNCREYGLLVFFEQNDLLPIYSE